GVGVVGWGVRAGGWMGGLRAQIGKGLGRCPGVWRSSHRLLKPPMPRTRVMNIRMTWSATRKNMEAMATMTNTMAVVTAVSRRLGHVTFCASARTSCKNLNGLIFAIELTCRHLGVRPQPIALSKLW